MKPALLRLVDLPVWLFLLAVSCPAGAAATPDFPALTGRVVDDAGLLAAGAKQELDQELRQHEQETGNQVVVVTLPSLLGYPIEDYGYQLGRHWGIGQDEHDNGVLLIVAPKEHKVRIEVGYGLEGTLTDARSSEIIQRIILPRFRDNDYPDGILRGTRAILSTLEGTYRPPASPSPHIPAYLIGMFVLMTTVGEFIGAVFTSRLVSAGILGGTATVLGWLVLGSLKIGLAVGFFIAVFHLFGGGGPTGRHGSRYRSGYYPGGGGGFSGGGGGFSGGGGSFGGGGASGGW